jgi:hypothetical protein
MRKVDLWEVSEGTGVVRLAESAVDLEQHLETWIAANPAMLQAGLEIIGRQVTLDAGRLDLLALDPQGGTVITNPSAPPPAGVSPRPTGRLDLRWP